MSLDPPSYIVSFQNNIRLRPISWEGAVRARTITEADLKKIKSIDKVRKEQRKQTVEADLDGFSALLLGNASSPSIFQAAAKRQDIIQYLLVLSGDLINDIEPFATRLIQHPDPYKPFLPFLSHSSNPEDSIPLLTSSFLSALLSHALTTITNPPHIETAIPKLNNYLCTLAKSSDSGLQDIAVQQYSAILRSRRARQLFWDQRAGTLSPLIDVLQAAAGGSDSDSTKMDGGSSVRSAATEIGLSGGVSIQLLYHVLLVIWQLSFEGEMFGPGLDRDHDILPLLTTLLRVSPKEKISRLLLATLTNLLTSNPSTLLPAAISARLPHLLANLKSRHVTDEDYHADVSALKQLLDDFSSAQTTFDEYAAEVRSGHLRWSPPHRSASFWKENARRVVEEERGELVKKLAEIMGKEWEGGKSVLAVGCNDVAWIVREVPDRKGVLERAGLKARVMGLMKEADEGVRWEALRATGEWLRYSFDG